MSADLSPALAGVACTSCPLGASSGGAEACPFRVQSFSAGTVLITAGKPPGQLIHVKDAVVELITTTMDGVEKRYSLRGPGSVLGWQALSTTPSKSEVRVSQSGDICTLPAAAARRQLDSDLGAALVWPLIDELEMTQCELTLSTQPATSRVARYLMSDIRCVSEELDGHTARSVARQLGIRHETLSWVLQKLEAAGIVERSPLRILDPSALRRIARTGHV
jgi:CRP-like cAMP-binding protein